MQQEGDDSKAYAGLSDLLIWVRSQWLLIVIPGIVCLSLGAVYAFIATPKYQVEALLSPVEPLDSGQGLSRLTSQLGSSGLLGILPQGGQSNKDLALAVLESRRFLGEFIVRHSLMPVLYESRWSSETGDWLDDGDPPPTINDAYRDFSESVMSVDTDELTGFVTVRLKWKDPEVALEWLTLLISDLNAEIRDRERAEAQRSLDFLEAELRRTDITELRQALFQLSLTELQRLTLANVREEFAFEIIDPPSAPDEDDYVSPKRAFAVLAGFSFGIIMGILLALVVTAWRVSAGRPARS